MSTEPEVAPYGGFMIKSLEEETKNLNDLTNHQYEIITQDGKTEIIRPEALKLIGVDNLSTKNIENYINYYINYDILENEEIDLITGELIKFKKYQLKNNNECIEFKIEWINDESINIIFQNIKDSNNVLRKLRDKEIINGGFEINDDNLRNEYLKQCIIETPAKSYNPIIEFEKFQNNQIDEINKNQQQDNDVGEGGMDEDSNSIELLIRQAFQSDKKVKNAREYSRYYLIHGEPERIRQNRKTNGRNRSYRERDTYRPRRRNNEEQDDDDEDLFADKLGKSNHHHHKKIDHEQEEEDLFADKLKHSNRDRSPTR